METLNKIKLAVVGIAGAITAVFGWMGWLVIGFALDYRERSRQQKGRLVQRHGPRRTMA